MKKIDLNILERILTFQGLIAQLAERQTEDLKVPSLILGMRILLPKHRLRCRFLTYVAYK